MKKNMSPAPHKLPSPKDRGIKFDRILEDIQKVYKSIEEKWAIIIVGASYCAMRISEFCAIRISGILFSEMIFLFKLILHFVEIVSALIFIIAILAWIKKRFFPKRYEIFE